MNTCELDLNNYLSNADRTNLESILVILFYSYFPLGFKILQYLIYLSVKIISVWTFSETGLSIIDCGQWLSLGLCFVGLPCLQRDPSKSAIVST